MAPSNLCTSIALVAVTVSFSCGCDKREPSPPEAATSQSPAPARSTATQPAEIDARESLRKDITENDPHTAMFKNPHTVFGSNLCAEIEDSELTVKNGSVAVTLRLENKGDVAVIYAPFYGVFYSGVYYSHPSGDRYTIEGDDRSIGLWTDAVTLDDLDSAGLIGPGESKRETVLLEVPADMPNPVEVEVGAEGPFVEAAIGLCKSKCLPWQTQTDSPSTQPLRHSGANP